MTESTDPRRGEIWLASLGAARRGEPGKNRPVVVISREELLIGDPGELIVVVPLSSSVASSRLRPLVDPGSGIDNDSAAVCRAVRGIARSRLLRRLGEANAKTFAEVEAALAIVLGLDRPAFNYGRLELEVPSTPMRLDRRAHGVVAVVDREMPTLTQDAVRETLERVRR